MQQDAPDALASDQQRALVQQAGQFRHAGQDAGGELLLGLAAVGVWIFFYRVPDPSTQTVAQLGLGLYCLALGGLLGALGALGALLAPE